MCGNTTTSRKGNKGKASTAFFAVLCNLAVSASDWIGWLAFGFGSDMFYSSCNSIHYDLSEANTIKNKSLIQVKNFLLIFWEIKILNEKANQNIKVYAHGMYRIAANQPFVNLA